MNSRERMIRVLNREIPDRVPGDLSWGYAPPFYEELKMQTGTDFWKCFGENFVSMFDTIEEYGYYK
ncbi:MAG: hypothetical protein MJB12_16690 [Firmicutes bacterium]|nr:hypothetical protein [Bacillota bacterium]